METKKAQLAAPCGMYCGVCAIYIAHRDDNQKFKERLTGLYGVAIDELHCKGCLSDDVFAYCRVCPIKACTAQKGIEGCHECADFPCGHIETFPFPVGKKVMLRSVPARRAREPNGGWKRRRSAITVPGAEPRSSAAPSAAEVAGKPSSWTERRYRRRWCPGSGIPFFIDTRPAFCYESTRHGE